jgi:hypothetical protein
MKTGRVSESLHTASVNPIDSIGSQAEGAHPFAHMAISG